MTHIDQLTIRMNGTGLRAYDSQQCLNGFTLLTPMNRAGTVYLIDMTGHMVHTWKLHHFPGLYGRLLPNGNLLYCGKIVEDLGRFQGWGRWMGESLR